MRESIVIYDNWGKLITHLPESQRLELIDMIFGYSFEDRYPISADETVNAIFSMIREKLDEDAAKYAEVCRKRSEAGKIGNDVRWHNRKSSQKVANIASAINVSQTSQKVASVADTDTDTDTDKEKEKSKEKDNSVISCRRFTPPSLQEVTDYVNSKGYSVDPQAFIDFYESKGWMIGKNKMKSWQSAVGTWERRSKKDRKSNPFKEFPQNKYDYDSLESKIIANK